MSYIGLKSKLPTREVSKINSKNIQKRSILEKEECRKCIQSNKKKIWWSNKNKSTRLRNKETRLKTLVYNIAIYLSKVMNK